MLAGRGLDVVGAGDPVHAGRTADRNVVFAAHGRRICQHVFLEDRGGFDRRGGCRDGREHARAILADQREAGVFAAGAETVEVEVVGKPRRQGGEAQPVLVAGAPDDAEAVLAEIVAGQGADGAVVVGEIVPGAERAAGHTVFAGAGAGGVLDLQVVGTRGGRRVDQLRHLAGEAVVVNGPGDGPARGIEQAEEGIQGADLRIADGDELIAGAGDQLDLEPVLVACQVDARAVVGQVATDGQRHGRHGHGSGARRTDDVVVVVEDLDPGIAALGVRIGARAGEHDGEALVALLRIEVGGDQDGEILLGLAGGEGHRAGGGAGKVVPVGQVAVALEDIEVPVDARCDAGDAAARDAEDEGSRTRRRPVGLVEVVLAQEHAAFVLLVVVAGADGRRDGIEDAVVVE